MKALTLVLGACLWAVLILWVLLLYIFDPVARRELWAILHVEDLPPFTGGGYRK